MTTSESLYEALYADNILLLTPGSIVDYGFSTVNDINATSLFGAYKAVLKFMPKEKFIKVMHQAFLDKKLQEIMEELTNNIQSMFRNHWHTFIQNNGEITPSYI
jgi:hypothetical protein